MSFWQAPIVVVALLTWLNSTPASFAEAAQREALRRQLMPKTTRQLSNLNLPASAIITEESVAAASADASGAAPAKTGDQAAAGSATGSSASESHDEQWWRDRMTSVRKDLDEHQRLASALQSQIAGLTTDFVNRDDPAQRSRIQNDRQKAMDALASMQKQIDSDQKAITAVQDDARKANVPPGWVR